MIPSGWVRTARRTSRSNTCDAAGHTRLARSAGRRGPETARHGAPQYPGRRPPLSSSPGRNCPRSSDCRASRLGGSGGYILHEPADAPRAVIIATGSEVNVVRVGGGNARCRGHRGARRVDAVWEIFTAQEIAWRDRVLPPALIARVSIEAGSNFGWHRWVRDGGIAIGIDHTASPLRASAYSGFGFTLNSRERDSLRSSDRGSSMKQHLVRLGELGQSRGTISSRATSCIRASLPAHPRGRPARDDVESDDLRKGRRVERRHTTPTSRRWAARCQPREIAEAIAVADVQAACDVFRPVYDASGHGDGTCVARGRTALARDTAGTIAERAIWARLDRPNAMIKITRDTRGLPRSPTASNRASTST